MSRLTFIQCLTFLASCILCLSAVQAIKLSTPFRAGCLNHPCPPGYKCRLNQVQCIRAPCPPIPECVRIQGSGHSGQCPLPIPGMVGPCVVRCMSDEDCRAGQKCCGSCPRQCTDVRHGGIVIQKPGRCPFYYPWRRSSSRCARPCRNDGDCNGKLKCCRAGRCGRTCQRPTWRRSLY